MGVKDNRFAESRELTVRLALTGHIGPSGPFSVGGSIPPRPLFGDDNARS
jgi:hypothetical protein